MNVCICVFAQDFKNVLKAKLNREEHNLPAGLQPLLKLMRAVATATDAKKVLRARMTSFSIYHGPNHVFSTSSPSDTNSALVCYYAGHRDVDLGARCTVSQVAKRGPKSTDCS